MANTPLPRPVRTCTLSVIAPLASCIAPVYNKGRKMPLRASCGLVVLLLTSCQGR